MADFIDFQRDFFYFWDWKAKNIEKILEKSDNKEIIVNNLLCQSKHYTFDFTDIVNIYLIDQILEKNEQLTILLPDNKKSRTTMLFASLLIQHWFNLKKKDKRESKFLFIGSPSVLHQYFKEIKWALRLKERNHPFYLQFSDFFPKTYILKDETAQSSQGDFIWDVHLPQILCHYSPTDPDFIIEKYKPDSILINFENKQKEDPWIAALIRLSREKNIPVIAFVQNSLSNVLPILHTLDVEVFFWPRKSNQDIPTKDLILSHKIDFNNYLIDFYETESTSITPIVIQSTYHWHFLKAYINLVNAKELSENELTLTAIKIGLKYLRLLEELPIPLKIYESECGNYWGLKKISRVKEALEKYLDAIEPNYQEIFEKISETSILLDKIYDDFYWNGEPEIWLALKNKIKQEVPENEIWILVFKVKARQKLFELTIFLEENITLEFLEKRRIFITCIKEIQKTLKRIKKPDSFDEIRTDLENKKIRSLIIGLPDRQSNPYLEDLFFQDTVEFLLYSHYYRAFEKRVDNWNENISHSLNSNVKILSKNLNDENPVAIPIQSNHLLLKQPELINFKRLASKTDHQNTISVTNIEKEAIKNAVNNQLLLLSDFEDDEDSYFIEENQNYSELDNNSTELFVNDAIEFQFSSGEKILFSPDDTLKIIIRNFAGDTGQISTIDKRACEIGVGEKILFIRGQKRQNLYDLLISRIHDNPSVELKLKMIKRWHEEFRTSFEKEKITKGRTLEDLVTGLQKRGSKITSTQTLSLWLSESTIAPFDKEDLRRLADELELGFVKKYYKEIFAAAQRIRGIHVGFANKLNHWLLNQAKGIMDDDKNISEFIDDELGITLQDFRDSLLILSVKNVEFKNGLFYKDDFGKLEA